MFCIRLREGRAIMENLQAIIFSKSTKNTYFWGETAEDLFQSTDLWKAQTERPLVVNWLNNSGSKQLEVCVAPNVWQLKLISWSYKGKRLVLKIPPSCGV